MKKLNVEWFYAAFVRAAKTVAQTALGMFTIGAAIHDVNWVHVLSVSAVAGVYSLLTSVATKLPEVGDDGVLEIETLNPDKDTYRFVFNDQLENLSKKKLVKFKVKDTPHDDP